MTNKINASSSSGLITKGSNSNIIELQSDRISGLLVNSDASVSVPTSLTVNGINFNDAASSISLPSLNDLKSLTTRPPIVTLKYISISTDNGGGTFAWYAGDTTTADDYYIIQPTIGPTGRYKRLGVSDNTILLHAIPGIDETGVTDSSTKINQILFANATRGCTLIIPRDAKIKISSDIVINVRQSIVGHFNPNDATGIPSIDYTKQASQIILSNGATIRLDNSGRIERVFVYRNGLVFNTDQGDFSSWTGNGIVLGYGNDQTVQDCMVLGFDYCITSLPTRGINGEGRVILNRVYVDGRNGIRLVGSYDSAYIDRIKAFGFVTQGYAGNPAVGEFYDPRKDRRPGIGFQLVDRSDGTKIGAIEVFGYTIGFKANTASWTAMSITADYPTTATYNSGNSGVTGVLLTKDIDPTGPRNIDYDPCQIGILQIWSTDIGLKLIGDINRTAQIGTGSIINTYGDGIQIDGGGLIAPNMRFALISGAPVKFLSAPNTKTIINGRATDFGAGRNSNNVPVVKTIVNSDANLIDVKIDSNQSLGALYFDNYPSFTSVSSADPLILPIYHGGNIESFTVTGTTGFSGMYGLRPGMVRLYFQSSLTIFAGAFSGGFHLPGGVASLVVAANSVITFEYNGAADRWYVISLVS